MAVIDMWAPIVPTRDVMAHVADNFCEPMFGYLRVFWNQEPTAEAVRRYLPSLATDDERIIAALDEADIVKALITGFDEASTAGGKTFVTNEVIAAVTERHPDRFIPFAGVDVMRGAEGVREVERWITERGFRGLSLRPFMINLPPDHPYYYPFYAKCVELDVPVSVHASANWTTERPSELAHPRHFDQVACDFPELKLILSHGGYPWVLEACLLAWKHPNVYLELAAHRPKYFVAPGSGWEPLLRFGQTTIQDKILYGSGAFLLGRQPAALAAEMRALGLDETVLDKWLYQNAARLLGLDASPGDGVSP
ncbi:MAG: amidohydrolase family protein [Polyangiales bacterium]|jgi:predicted TIM-barrel fold metal-dependent hydrolase